MIYFRLLIPIFFGVEGSSGSGSDVDATAKLLRLIEIQSESLSRAKERLMNVKERIETVNLNDYNNFICTV